MIPTLNEQETKMSTQTIEQQSFQQAVYEDTTISDEHTIYLLKKCADHQERAVSTLARSYELQQRRIENLELHIRELDERLSSESRWK